MIEEQGIVLDVRDGRARVELERKGLGCCGGCAFCTSDGRSRTIEVDAPPELAPGDRVTVAVPVRTAIVGVFLLLVVPMVLLVGGTIAGSQVFPGSGQPGQVNFPALGVGAALMVFWYAGVRWSERKRTQSRLSPPRIVKVVPRAGAPGR